MICIFLATINVISGFLMYSDGGYVSSIVNFSCAAFIVGMLVAEKILDN